MSPTVAELVDIIEQGLRVFVTRDGVPLTPEMINERARNLAMAIVGNFDVREAA